MAFTSKMQVCQQETVDNLAKQEHKKLPQDVIKAERVFFCTYKNQRKKRIWSSWIIDSSGYLMSCKSVGIGQFWWFGIVSNFIYSSEVADT